MEIRMNRSTRNNLIGAVLISVLFVFGCIPVTQREMTQKTPTPSSDLISPRMLEMKMADLNRLLTSNTLDERQRKIALRLLSTYQKIQSDALDQGGQGDCAATIKTLFGFLTEMDETLLKNSQKEPGLYQQSIQQYFQSRKMIFDDYLYGNYQGVVDKAIELENSFGVDILTPEIGLVFAASLAKRGMLEEALKISERIVRELEGRPDLIHLLADMVEWESGLGNREKALQAYEKLLDNLDERKVLIRRSQKTLVLKTDKRPSPADKSVPAERDPAEAGEELISTDQLGREIERLLESREHRKAKILIVQRRLKTQDPSEIIFLDRAFQRVEQAEAEFKNHEPENAIEEDPLKLAKILVEEEKFEEAIERITALEENEINASEANALKLLATEGMIKRERKKAARLFLMAKNSPDPEKKKKHLLSSYDILKQIVDKYPLSSLNSKINGNIKTVENELEKLGIYPE